MEGKGDKRNTGVHDKHNPYTKDGNMKKKCYKTLRIVTLR